MMNNCTQGGVQFRMRLLNCKTFGHETRQNKYGPLTYQSDAINQKTIIAGLWFYSPFKLYSETIEK